MLLTGGACAVSVRSTCINQGRPGLRHQSSRVGPTEETEGDPRRVSVKHRQIECVDLFCSTPIKKISKKSGTAKRRVRLGQAAAPSASPRPHALRGSDGRTPLGSATGTNGVGNTDGRPPQCPGPQPWDVDDGHYPLRARMHGEGGSILSCDTAKYCACGISL